MEKLSPQQLATLHHHLIHSGSTNVLIDELLDHLACEVEYYMWIGLSFDAALKAVLEQANNKAVQHLQSAYKVELAMTEEQLRQASLDDIVFEFRNKSYGAYDLRQAYRINLRNAFIMTIGLCLMLMAMMDGISRRTWSYLSPWGVAWLIGLSSVTFVVISWYLQSTRQQPTSVSRTFIDHA
ncbi:MULTISPECIES: hypothetical protein [Spirosoma]|uniref:Uncharacterized protein n=1 Tax=Spirosoma liriopis TaxID=2937440 RepID=A0ABT0HEM0_9BACT|nr:MULTISPECIES: hypothetical protein [Spirosoma]MCK8490297.1 hypothetical protein [Spirosoma liriopis]UHG89673.1 hypothetical protein LQ777_15620 [Spirosoma oryzicola]